MRIAVLSVLAVTAAAFTSTAPSVSKGGTSSVVNTVRPSFGLYASVANKVSKEDKVQTSSTSSSTAKKSDITPEQVRNLFGLWNDALATGDSRIVASRYAPGATLLPTVSKIVASKWK
jgi:hypothetical protein